MNDVYDGPRVRLGWECSLCEERYTSERPYEKVKGRISPVGPPCPECGASYPNYEGLEFIEET